MAKIIEDKIVITVSRLVKDDFGSVAKINYDELVQTLETVAQELVGDSAVIEGTILNG